MKDFYVCRTNRWSIMQTGVFDRRWTNTWKLLDNNLSIEDNWGMSIGIIIQYFALDIIDKIMPDNIPFLKTRFSCKVLRSLSIYWSLNINDSNSANQAKLLWLIYFKKPSRTFENVKIRELRNRNGKINK